MEKDKNIVEEVPNFYRIIALTPFRKTKGVHFDIFPMQFLPRVDGVDRVIHESDAMSPGSVAGVERPWYLHQSQEDNLIVLHGSRTVDIFTLEHRRVENFVVEPNRVLKNGEVVFEGAAMLVWPCNVFHRIRSGPCRFGFPQLRGPVRRIRHQRPISAFTTWIRIPANTRSSGPVTWTRIPY